MYGPGAKAPTEAMFITTPALRATIAGRQRPVSSTSTSTLRRISSSPPATGRRAEGPAGPEPGVVPDPSAGGPPRPAAAHQPRARPRPARALADHGGGPPGDAL